MTINHEKHIETYMTALQQAIDEHMSRMISRMQERLYDTLIDSTDSGIYWKLLKRGYKGNVKQAMEDFKLLELLENINET